MAKFCTKCGAQLTEGAKFCTSCGANIEQPSTPEKTPQTTSSQPTNYTPMPPKPKSNMKIIGAILAVIIAVVIVLVVVFMFLDLDLGGSDDNNGSSGGTADSRFVGEWYMDTGYGNMTYNFKSNGNLAISMYETVLGDVGTWTVSGDQLCIEFNSQWAELAGGEDLSQCIDYEFSDGGNTLTLTQNGSSPTVLTKTGSSSQENGDDGGSSDNGGGDYTGELLGSWINTSGSPGYSSTSIWTFYSNGTVKMESSYDWSDETYVEWAEFEVQSGQLCFVYYGYPMCFDITFSGSNSFTYDSYGSMITFTRLT